MSEPKKQPQHFSDRINDEGQHPPKSTHPKLRYALGLIFTGLVLSGAAARNWQISDKPKPSPDSISQSQNAPTQLFDNNGYPLLNPPPPADAEVWECEVAVVGGSLGGVAAAYHSMKTGATTCLIELTPMLGGQVSSQGVSAIDESLLMRYRQEFPLSWTHFKNIIASQPALPEKYSYLKPGAVVADTNSCWVGNLCFTPYSGELASEEFLRESQRSAPQSRWGTQIAFKGASFNAKGDRITSIHAVRRIPRDPNYIAKGRLSRELKSWFTWNSDEVFEKKAIRLQAPAGKQLMVIDATDTAELIAWANLPHRVGAEGFETTGEVHAVADNPECTQAFTFPFVLKIADDNGQSLKELSKVQPGYSREEHRLDYDLGRFPMFVGNSMFNYRRIVSMKRDDPFTATPASGDMTVVNWNRGNDWGIMNPPLILTDKQIRESGQQHNWMGGLDTGALKDGENHALLFAEWLIEKYASAEFPLRLMSGFDSPMPTESGLSMYPYIREGRRILGRAAYGQTEFMMREQDIRNDMEGARDFTPTSIGLTHYAIDMHGCRYRNWEPSKSPSAAPANEDKVRPIILPFESLIPQRIDNLLIGGKSMAVSHIVNGATRIHVGEWSAGSAAGVAAAWIAMQNNPDLSPQAVLDRNRIGELQELLRSQGVVMNWTE
ncbi:FAD-dependent oxidoreductase [Pseudanabaena mucicola]|uniref:FAD-dependent oxidoreductase n=1 Tax=Pseudanabaena mucicola FACHB-723 TaxID=2692860 RepID=A0ABR8A1F8_9CYAN|nr:FAD-dependent oxidoreductase [Pseudanabaena mucicola]MBD2189669.1 FAD-dependent oxidoreductase [Pseudanabaena mucicola FACHB-723]